MRSQLNVLGVPSFWVRDLNIYYIRGSVGLATGMDTGEERILALLVMESQFLSHVASCSPVPALRYPDKNKHFSSSLSSSSSSSSDGTIVQCGPLRP